jgi:RNA polymerase sigma-70 factor (ECF subfamily)
VGPDSAPAGIREQIDDLQPNLLRFARSLTSSFADADDLAQETLARALRFEDRFEPGTDARAWLFTICRRLQQRRWRTDRTRPAQVALADLGDDPGREDELLVSPLSVEPVVMRRFEKVAVLQALRRLTPEQAVPLRLYAGEGMPYRDIAAVLDLPLGTVMSRIYRGRRRLVKLLLEEGVR